VDVLRDVVMAGAVVTTGLLAGLYYAYACSVMLALRDVDDATFVEVMQRINTSILNGWFMVSFLGSPVLGLLLLVLHLGEEQRSALAWAAAAAACNAASFLVTVAVNVPLNNALEAAGPVGAVPDSSAVRHRFEARWVRWNLVRAVASTAGLVALVVALVR
jgi:uncharacterized membrane protein